VSNIEKRGGGVEYRSTLSTREENELIALYNACKTNAERRALIESYGMEYTAHDPVTRSTKGIGSSYTPSARPPVTRPSVQAMRDQLEAKRNRDREIELVSKVPGVSVKRVNFDEGI
jgi:hypothetical protein